MKHDLSGFSGLCSVSRGVGEKHEPFFEASIVGVFSITSIHHSFNTPPGNR
jgi:hypothetical protein